MFLKKSYTKSQNVFNTCFLRLISVNHIPFPRWCHKHIYSLSDKLCTRLCCALLCCRYVIRGHFKKRLRMMTSSNGNICPVPGPLCGEFTGHRWIPLTKASDAEFWCFIWSAPELNGWVKNREAGDLRRHRVHYDITVMELLNLKEHLNIHLWKIHIFQCMDKIFCVECHRVPFKFRTKYLTHTLKDTILYNNDISKALIELIRVF